MVGNECLEVCSVLQNQTILDPVRLGYGFIWIFGAVGGSGSIAASIFPGDYTHGGV